jgi:hypothetical protein
MLCAVDQDDPGLTVDLESERDSFVSDSEGTPPFRPLGATVRFSASGCFLSSRLRKEASLLAILDDDASLSREYMDASDAISPRLPQPETGDMTRPSSGVDPPSSRRPAVRLFRSLYISFSIIFLERAPLAAMVE